MQSTRLDLKQIASCNCMKRREAGGTLRTSSGSAKYFINGEDEKRVKGWCELLHNLIGADTINASDSALKQELLL